MPETRHKMLTERETDVYTHTQQTPARTHANAKAHLNVLVDAI